MTGPPAGCWACGARPGAEDLRLRGLIHARSSAEGGPFTRFACASCGVDTVVEESPEGDAVLAPPEAAGVEVPNVALVLDGAAARDERRRARGWMERHGPALERLRQARRRAAPSPPPRSNGRPGDAGSHRANSAETSPPPPPTPAPPVRDLPSTPAEARAVLGVPEGASAADVEAAFRAASRKCHPDLVAHLDEDFQRLAHEKFLRLRRAQEILAPAAEARAAAKKRREGP